MSPQKTTSSKGKRYHFEFSRSSLAFWGLGMFFLLAWIFVLGILVGRGFFPEGVKGLSELKIQIARLQDMLSTKDSSGLEQIKGPDEEPKFAFYDQLSTKRKEGKARKDHLTASRSGSRKKPDKSRDKKIKPSETGGAYALQIASLESEIKAARMADRLTNHGYPAYYYKVNIKGKPHYRVRCGTFKTKREASYYKDLLAREERIDGLVIRVRK